MLAIESGRYNNTPREERLCIHCNMNTIENEYHFPLVCPFYADLRRKYLSPYYCRWPTLNKFKSLMQNKTDTTVNKLSKFIYYAHNCLTQSSEWAEYAGCTFCFHVEQRVAVLSGYASWKRIQRDSETATIPWIFNPKFGSSSTLLKVALYC